MLVVVVLIILWMQVSQDVVVRAPAQSEVIDVVVQKKGKKGTDGLASRDKKSRAFSTDWLALCDSLGEGQD